MCHRELPDYFQTWTKFKSRALSENINSGKVEKLQSLALQSFDSLTRRKLQPRPSGLHQLAPENAISYPKLTTCAELAGAELEHSEGKSLLPVLKGEVIGSRALFWRHEGNRGVLEGDWKLVAARDKKSNLFTPPPRRLLGV